MLHFFNCRLFTEDYGTSGRRTVHPLETSVHLQQETTGRRSFSTAIRSVRSYTQNLNLTTQSSILSSYHTSRPLRTSVTNAGVSFSSFHDQLHTYLPGRRNESAVTRTEITVVHSPPIRFSNYYQVFAGTVAARPCVRSVGKSQLREVLH